MPLNFMKSIKAKLIGIIVVALVAAVGGSSFVIHHNAKKALTDYVEQSIATLATSSGNGIGLWLEGKKFYISALANTRLIQDGDQAKILPYLAAEVERLKQFETLFVANGKGDFFSYTRKSIHLTAGNTGNLSDRAYFREVMRGNSVISDPLFSKTTSIPVAIIAVPIIKEGRITGLMGGTIPLDELARRVATVKVAKTGYAYVVQGDGRTIIHPDKNVAMKLNVLQQGNNFDPKLLEAVRCMVRRESGVARYVFYKVDKYVGYAPVPGVNWSLGVTVPVHEVTEQLSTMKTISLITPIWIATVISIITGLLITVTIIRPISKLRASMSMVEAGYFEAQDTISLEGDIGAHAVSINDNLDVLAKWMGSSEDEIGQLAGSFDRMLEKIKGYNLHLENLVDELKRYQQHLEDMVKERTAELEKAYVDLKRLDEMKSAFLSSVSHELRTPLTSILGFACLIKEKLEDAILPLVATDEKKVKRAVGQVRSNLDIIVSEGERLTKIINDVLDLAKMEAGKMEWAMERTSIAEIIERATAATAVLFQQKGLVLIKEVDKDLPDFTGDGDKLIQAVINLISNAIKFTEEGTVTCRATSTGSEIKVSVIDSGIGIAKGDQEEVFDKFRQIGDTLTDKPKGTGLGLPICKQIIEHHGGRIWVESQPGQGSNFSFTIALSEKGAVHEQH